MMNFIITHYLAFKAAHIISVICWMAGLLYLPRIFVYHAGAVLGGEADSTFKVMEYKLYYYIMHPSMLASYLFGGAMFMAQEGMMAWVHAKLLCVVLLTGCHIAMGRYLRDFSVGQNKKSARYFRVFNEVPSVLMLIIVVLAVTKPF